MTHESSLILPTLFISAHPEPGTLTDIDVLVGVAKECPVCAADHPGVQVLHVPLVDDGPPSDEDWALALKAAENVMHHRTAGRRVLVSCKMGYNRSGLVVALALVQQGYTGKAAIALLRQGRGHNALNNEFFEARVKRL